MGRPKKLDSERRDQTARTMILRATKASLTALRGDVPESEWIAEAICQRIDRDTRTMRRRK